jgi:hypothetical protein
MTEQLRKRLAIAARADSSQELVQLSQPRHRSLIDGARVHRWVVPGGHT